MFMLFCYDIFHFPMSPRGDQSDVDRKRVTKPEVPPTRLQISFLFILFNVEFI